MQDIPQEDFEKTGTNFDLYMHLYAQRKREQKTLSNWREVLSTLAIQNIKSRIRILRLQANKIFFKMKSDQKN